MAGHQVLALIIQVRVLVSQLMFWRRRSPGNLGSSPSPAGMRRRHEKNFFTNRTYTFDPPPREGEMEGVREKR